MPPGLAVLLLAGALLAAGDTAALESDQYYASARPLEDSSLEINAKVNDQIRATLQRLNRNRHGHDMLCERVVEKISRTFKMFIFQDIELWALNASRVPRIPATPEEELHYRQVGLFRKTSFVDFGAALPPVPTIEIDGIRLGTDKLSHFFAEGWRYHRRFTRARRSGMEEADAEMRAMRIGFFLERTVLGLRTSGVFSFGDLEANYQGMRFFRGFCEGDAPFLEREAGAWRLARPVDLRRYVTPEWDESYRNSVFSRGRWKKVRPVLLGYCPLLEDARTVERIASYALRDEVTPTDALVEEMVRAGRLPEPRHYSLEANCPASPATESAGILGIQRSADSSSGAVPTSPGSNASDAELMQ